MKDVNPAVIVMVVYFVVIAGFMLDWLTKSLWRK